MTDVRFTVLGVPQPQGSKTVGRTAGGRSFVREDNPGLKPWRDSIRAAALDAMAGRAPIDGPVELHATFVFGRPKAHFGTGRNAGTVKPSAPLYVATRPDVDKLVRALGDSLTGIVFRDDAALAIVLAEKHYGDPPHAFVEVRELDGRVGDLTGEA